MKTNNKTCMAQLTPYVHDSIISIPTHFIHPTQFVSVSLFQFRATSKIYSSTYFEIAFNSLCRIKLIKKFEIDIDTCKFQVCCNSCSIMIWYNTADYVISSRHFISHHVDIISFSCKRYNITRISCWYYMFCCKMI